MSQTIPLPPFAPVAQDELDAIGLPTKCAPAHVAAGLLGCATKQELNWVFDQNNKNSADRLARQIRQLRPSPASVREMAVSGPRGRILTMQIGLVSEYYRGGVITLRANPGLSTTMRSAASDGSRVGVVGSGTFTIRYSDDCAITWSTGGTGLTTPLRIRYDSVSNLWWVGDTNAATNVGMASSPNLVTNFTVYDTGSDFIHSQFDVSQATGTVISAARDSGNIRLVRRVAGGSWTSALIATTGTTGVVWGVCCNELWGVWSIAVIDGTNSVHRIYYSTDDGVSWAESTSIASAVSPGVFDCMVAHGPLVIAGLTGSTRLLVSRDGGITWPDTIHLGVAGNAPRVYVANNQLFVSLDSSTRLTVPVSLSCP